MPRSLWTNAGLFPAADWEMDIDFCKSPFGRRVVVRVTHRATGRTAEEAVVGTGLRKSDRDRWANELLGRLARRMGLSSQGNPRAQQGNGKRKRRR
jgi:hypothetical protein